MNWMNNIPYPEHIDIEYSHTKDSILDWKSDEVCDSCCLIAYDEGFESSKEQEEVMIEMGEMCEDHLCDAQEEPDIKCLCGCRTRGQI